MKYEIILFDLDGTLLNTLDDLADSVNHVMKEMHFPTHSLDDIRSYVGNGIRNLMIKSTPDGESNPSFEDAFSMFTTYYLSHNQRKTKPYKHVMAMLNALQKKGFPMAIVTNKNQPSVDILLRDMFDGSITVAVGDDGIRQKKPNAAPVYEALRRLGYEINDDTLSKTLYVGDSEVDAATAQNAGLDCVLCTWGFRERELLSSLPHTAMIDDPMELLTLLSQA